MDLAAADDPRNGASDSGEQTIYVCLPGCTVGKIAGPGGNEGQAPGASSASMSAFSRRLTAPWQTLGLD